MADEPGESVALCVLLWAHPGRVDELVAYEDEVLQLLGVHGAALLSRVRSKAGSGSDAGLDAGPTEVHVVRFPSPVHFDAYRADPRRVAMAARRDAAIVRAEVQPVTVVEG